MLRLCKLTATTIEDEELGRLVLCVRARAKRLVFRTKKDAIYVSVPPRVTLEEAKDVIEKMRHQLSISRKKISRARIDLNYRIDTEHFKLSLIKGKHDKFLTHSKVILGEIEIVCPPETDFDNDRMQVWLQKVIEEALRKSAKTILPQRLSTLSVQYALPFQEVKINSGRSRWGSCSARKAINLSCFMLLLPQHLIDYILLHELCHTREMNHSNRFWALLNGLTDGNALALRKELGKYKTEIV